MPTKNTGTVVARVKDEIIAKIKQKTFKKGISVNAWLNWCITLGLRKHGRKDK